MELVRNPYKLKYFRYIYNMIKLITIITIVLLVAYGIVSLSYKDGKIEFTPPLIHDNSKFYDSIKVLQLKIDSLNNMKKTITKIDTLYLEHIKYIKDKVSKDTNNVSKLSDRKSKDTFFNIFIPLFK